MRPSWRRWYARRFGESSAIGALADAVVDKLFVAIVAVSLLVSGSLDLVAVLLLGVRDAGEAFLGAAILWTSPTQLARPRRALPLSKAATALQFATVAAALFGVPVVGLLASATALVGALAVAEYWSRERAYA